VNRYKVGLYETFVTTYEVEAENQAEALEKVYYTVDIEPVESEYCSLDDCTGIMLGELDENTVQKIIKDNNLLIEDGTVPGLCYIEKVGDE
jgi:hypothetical protein